MDIFLMNYEKYKNVQETYKMCTSLYHAIQTYTRNIQARIPSHIQAWYKKRVRIRKACKKVALLKTLNHVFSVSRACFFVFKFPFLDSRVKYNKDIIFLVLLNSIPLFHQKHIIGFDFTSFSRHDRYSF